MVFYGGGETSLWTKARGSRALSSLVLKNLAQNSTLTSNILYVWWFSCCTLVLFQSGRRTMAVAASTCWPDSGASLGSRGAKTTLAAHSAGSAGRIWLLGKTASPVTRSAPPTWASLRQRVLNSCLSSHHKNTCYSRCCPLWAQPCAVSAAVGRGTRSHMPWSRDEADCSWRGQVLLLLSPLVGLAVSDPDALIILGEALWLISDRQAWNHRSRP